MRELSLKYGCNPNQTPARVLMESGELPIDVLSGRPGYINLLDALNGYALVRELKEALSLPAAASFKHVSPAGAAVGLPLSDALREICFVKPEDALSPLACAYARARGADRMSSFGDFIALSDTCDLSTAKLIAREVSDGIIAPGYDPDALAVLRGKRKGNYVVLAMDERYRPAPIERKMVYGVTFEQGRNEQKLDASLLCNVLTRQRALPASAQRDLLVALIALKYTQSNSVAYAYDGQTTGVGAGQQSRIHCTRLAGNKSDLWFLRQSERVRALPFLPALSRPERDNAVDAYLSEDADDVLGEANWPNFFTERPAPFEAADKKAYLAGITGVSLASDAFFPFGDNIDRAARSGVSYIAQPGGSIRDDHVIEACDRYGIAMAMTGVRLFHH